MHLALVTPYPPSRGTLVEYGFYMAKALEQNPKVHRLSIVADWVEGAPESENIERVWRFGAMDNAWRIARSLDRLQPDGVLFNLQFATFGDQPLPASLGLLAPWMARRSGLPTISLLHNLFETIDLKEAGYAKNPVKEKVMRLGGKLFTRMLLQSNLLATTMPRYVSILREQYRASNVFLSPHGAFADPGPPLPITNTKRVMAFGKFGTYKKLETLLEAHRILLSRDPEVELMIAGSDAPKAQGYIASIQEQYADLPNVFYTGYVPEEEVEAVFAGCTVVAFPYTGTTGSSGVLHQAGQYARAAVMPNIGDLAELVEAEGYRAEFFEPGNPQSLAEALWQVLSNTTHAQNLGLTNYGASVGVLLSEVMDWHLLHFESLMGKTHQPAKDFIPSSLRRTL